MRRVTLKGPKSNENKSCIFRQTLQPSLAIVIPSSPSYLPFLKLPPSQYPTIPQGYHHYLVYNTAFHPSPPFLPLITALCAVKLPFFATLTTA